MENIRLWVDIWWLRNSLRPSADVGVGLSHLHLKKEQNAIDSVAYLVFLADGQAEG